MTETLAALDALATISDFALKGGEAATDALKGLSRMSYSEAWTPEKEKTERVFDAAKFIGGADGRHFGLHQAVRQEEVAGDQ